MTLVRFGKACEGPGCSVVFNDYSVGPIRQCEDCDLDLCPACAVKSFHVEGKDADVDTDATWREVTAEDVFSLLDGLDEFEIGGSE